MRYYAYNNTWFVAVSKNQKFPDGHQEFTSSGEHCLNSGAYFEGYIGDDFIWGDSNSICVDVQEYEYTPV